MQIKVAAPASAWGGFEAFPAQAGSAWLASQTRKHSSAYTHVIFPIWPLWGRFSAGGDVPVERVSYEVADGAHPDSWGASVSSSAQARSSTCPTGGGNDAGSGASTGGAVTQVVLVAGCLGDRGRSSPEASMQRTS